MQAITQSMIPVCAGLAGIVIYTPYLSIYHDMHVLHVRSLWKWSMDITQPANGKLPTDIPVKFLAQQLPRISGQPLK